MIRLILKNLWARRRRNGWLLAELIVVTVLTWHMLDPVVVMTHNRSLPLGYEPEGLYMLQLGILPSQAPAYQEGETDSASSMKNLHRLLDELRHYPDIHSATPILTFAYPASQGSYGEGYKRDSLLTSAQLFPFLPRTGYFETYGIRGAEGCSAKQLDERDYASDEIICTQSISAPLFHGAPVLGKTVYTTYQGDTAYYRIVGVTEPVSYRSFEQTKPIAFVLMSKGEVDNSAPKIAFRLKKGVQESRFLHDFRPWMNSRLKAGNLYASTLINYNKLIKDVEYSYGITNKYRMNIILCFFFLINLVLGVTGTFWLQTRSRREEVGIMLSYGGSASYIRRMLMGEGVILATVAVVTGCLVYLQYGLKEGLFRVGDLYGDYWINSFSLHFIAVSLLSYLIIVSVVLLGIYIPARQASRIQPTEALRDE